MTIQVAIANSYGVVLASDRHVFRGGEARSTGQDVKLLSLRGAVPAAMMASGPFSVFGFPVSRLALRLERAIAGGAATGTPDALALSVLHSLELPLGSGDGREPTEADAAMLAEIADDVLEPALAAGSDPRASIESLLAEMETSPYCHAGERMEAVGRSVWAERAALLPGLVSKPAVAAALQHEPDLCGRAVIGALSRDWRKASDLYLSVGLCCPTTGVPVLIALRLWRGVGNRLHFASRLDLPYEAVWKANRTVAIAQGSGRAVVEAMIDGLSDDHWGKLDPAWRDSLRPGMSARWDRAHDRIGVSSPRELMAVATGLIRGAEVIGYLTRESEGTIAEIDCAVLTARGASDYTLEAGQTRLQAA